LNGHDHGISGNLLEMYRTLREKEPDGTYIVFAKRDLFMRKDHRKRKSLPGMIADFFRFFVVLPYHMATAQTVFFNDNFLPLAYMHTAKETRFVQLWHGAGAFKRFGLSTEKDPAVVDIVTRANQRMTHLFVTSAQVIPCYREAFAVPEERIYATGIPATDLYFDEPLKQQRIKKFYGKYPQLSHQKILLYAPTFRKTPEENREIMKQFDPEKIHSVLGDEWTIFIKFHPKFPMENIPENAYCYNMTYYNDISDLYLVADLLITDYSSTVVEYVLLDKPVLFFAYDLPSYDRGFYFDYESVMPGKVAHSSRQLLEILQKDWDDSEKRQSFVNFEYDNVSGNACERILDILER
jgi:CDP-ribitol ribitolphosphotransferase